jgi:hypothetical protein
MAASTVIVEARDAAIVRAVKASPTPLKFAQLLERLPDEKWPTPDARQAALANALTRLRVKKVIRLIDNAGWVAA